MARLPFERLPFVKMQAVGNDFVVVDARDWPVETAWDTASVFLCDRKFGVGSDGLLVVGPSQVADVRMRMFNPDGTEDMCGNGLRCVVRRTYDTGVVAENSRIETLAGIRNATVHSDGSITTDMGTPKFALDAIPVNSNGLPPMRHNGASNLNLCVVLLHVPFSASVHVDAVNTGSTHAVLWKTRLPNDDEFFAVSPCIETDTTLFPERTSIMWAVVEGENALRLRIWERGAGETLGCGTGACAAAVLARQTGRINADQIVVHSKGGTLHVSWAGGETDPMFLTGTAHTVYEGTIKYPPPTKEASRAES